MWRVSSILRSHPNLRRSLAHASRNGRLAAATVIHDNNARFFSSREGLTGGEDDEEEPIDILQHVRNSRWASPPDLEFLDDKESIQKMIDDIDDDDDADDEQFVEDDEYKRQQEEIREELESRTGRIWSDPWEITDEDFMSTEKFEDLPDFSPEFVSRISQERVKLHPDGIPTLSTLAQLPLPPPARPHPGMEGQTKAYATFRKRYQYKYILGKVSDMVQPKLKQIFSLPSWEEKQDAVDELFETVEAELKDQEEVLGLHPHFGQWVEKAIEEYLSSASDKDVPSEVSDDAKEGADLSSTNQSSKAMNDEDAHPVFMDCFSPEEPDEMVPKILSPLKPHHADGPGRMVEEWELSSHRSTKRILLRQCTRSIARVLEDNDASRIYVHGRKGVGKSAVLASIVASARRSGHIVLYLPDGDRLRKNGFFITPNAKRKGMFDLQNLSQEVCQQLFDNHGADMKGMETDNETLEKFFTEKQLKRYEEFSENENMTSLVQLLKYAQHRKLHAPICYVVVIDQLMKQEDKPFTMVLDEFNCYFDRGHYFHMEYDEDVKEAIPYEKINLFEQSLGAMAISTAEDDDDLQAPKLMKRGGIIVGVTESHAVRRKVTDGLTAFAKRQAQNSNLEIPLHEFEVPRYSDIEADHILANFEATGVGKLRLDRGETIMNEQEVSFLKMISGNIGQQLLDASII